MQRTLVLPDETVTTTLKFDPELYMDDDQFFDFCMANPDLRLERTPQGEIVIVPPVGFEGDYQNTDAITQLRNWAKRDGRGKASGATAGFSLPTGALYSPDAAWLSNERIAQIPKPQRKKFPRVCPEFVIEVMSPSDRLKPSQEKMSEWMRAGVDLGWLIHPDKTTVYIYRAGQEKPEPRTGITKLAGQGPVAGFELDLTDIWTGL